jgi:hypothetical protein
MTQSQILRICLTLVDRRDAGTARPNAASPDHDSDLIRGTGEHGLNRSVAAVTDPTFKPVLDGRVFGPGAKSHTLHQAANDDMTNTLRAPHPNSPTSFVRVPHQPDGNQR